MEYSNELYNELYRPQFHITPKQNWLNDPNGMVYYDNEYHVFYQYWPEGKFPNNGLKHWAHVVSCDLVHWTDLPIAISPDNDEGIWSGSAVVDEKNSSELFNDTENKRGLVAYYTQTNEKTGQQRQCMAYSKDKGRTFIKYNSGLPIIDVKDDPLNDHDFRDPKVFWHDESNRWIMVVAGGPLRFYSSENLIDWKPEGMQKDIRTECPDFFKLYIDGDKNKPKWVLSGCGEWYMIGDFNIVNGVWRFVPDSYEKKPFNFAPDMYAAQTFSNIENRVIKIDWMVNINYPFETGEITSNWNGALSLPYELSLKTVENEILLVQKPIKELENLRCVEHNFDNLEITENTTNLLSDFDLDIYEIKATIKLLDAEKFGFRFKVGENQYTEVNYDVQSEILTLDRSKSGLAPKPEFLKSYSKKIKSINGEIELHIFIDRSSVEMFVQDGLYPFTALIFADESKDNMEFYVNGGSVKLKEYSLYELSGIHNIK